MDAREIVRRGIHQGHNQLANAAAGAIGGAIGQLGITAANRAVQYLTPRNQGAAIFNQVLQRRQGVQQQAVNHRARRRLELQNEDRVTRNPSDRHLERETSEPIMDERLAIEDAPMQAVEESGADTGGTAMGGGSGHAIGQTMITPLYPSLNVTQSQTYIFRKRIPVQFAVNTQDQWQGIALKDASLAEKTGRNEWIGSNAWNVVPIRSTALYMNRNELDFIKKRPFYRYKRAAVNFSNFNVHSSTLQTPTAQWIQNTSGVACYSAQLNSKKFLPWLTCRGGQTGLTAAAHDFVETFMNDDGSYKLWDFHLGVLGQRYPLAEPTSTTPAQISEDLMLPDLNRMSAITMDRPAHSSILLTVPEDQWRSSMSAYTQGQYVYSTTLGTFTTDAAQALYKSDSTPQALAMFPSIYQPLNPSMLVVTANDEPGALNSNNMQQKLNYGYGGHEWISVEQENIPSHLPGERANKDYELSNLFDYQNGSALNGLAGDVQLKINMQQQNKGDLWIFKFMVPVRSGQEGIEPDIFINGFLETMIEVEVDDAVNDMRLMGKFLDMPGVQGPTPQASKTYNMNTPRLAGVDFDQLINSMSYGFPMLSAGQCNPYTEIGDVADGRILPFGNAGHGRNTNPSNNLFKFGI